MPSQPYAADSEKQGTTPEVGRRTRIAVGVAAATIVTAIPTGAIATVAVVIV